MRTWLPAKRELPGIGLALAIGLVASAAGRVFQGSTPYLSDVVLAIGLGALVLNTPLRRWIRLGDPVDRDTDPYERGLRYTGKWVLRLAIVLLGLKIHADIFHLRQLWVACVVIAVALPTAFCVAQFTAARLGLRRESADLMSIGTMVCGASAINALAPVVYARRRDQGLAITTVFLFSVLALIVFHPIGRAIGLPDEYAGLWSGLAVNDLSSSIAVGSQFSDQASLIATASKSVRILLLGPILVGFSLFRRRASPGAGAPEGGRSGLAQHLPLFLIGYFALCGVRLGGDAVFRDAPAWSTLLAANDGVVKILVLTVCGGIGLQVDLRTIVDTGWKVLATGAAASVSMASVCLWMLFGVANGSTATALGGGAAVAFLALGFYGFGQLIEPERVQLLRRFHSGAPLSMREAVGLLDLHDADDALLPEVAERILRQLYPAIGELQPLRDSPIVPPINYRRLTYWVSPRGRGSLVSMLWPPGTQTHIHSHNYVGVGKNIEGRIQVTNFQAVEPGRLRVAERFLMDAGTLLPVDGARTIHAVYNVTDRDSIDVHFYGPDLGTVPERFDPAAAIDLRTLDLRAEVAVRASPDEIPVHFVSDKWRHAA